MPEIKIPDCFMCKITHELFFDPVITENGNTFEKEYI